MTKSRKPYNDRTDLEKLQSQWWKLSGLNSREEWSAAVVRAATAAEIAANIAIRSEFQSIGSFPAGFVDSLLMWANGLKGKLEKILLPISKDTERAAAISELKSLGLQVNNIRNGIAHRGEFCSRTKAQDAIGKAKEFIEGVVRLYEQGSSSKSVSPNNSFKPNLLRYTKHMAEKACHVFGSTTQFGLTQALGRTERASNLADHTQSDRRAGAVAQDLGWRRFAGRRRPQLFSAPRL